MARIILVAPRFEPSFFGFDYAMPVLGKSANMPVAALPLLAALTPGEHEVTLVDEAAEPLDYDAIAEADIVGLTGMNVQRFRMVEIAKELKARGAFLAIGGPWVTVQEDYFEGLADVIFIGEADTTWPQFLSDWAEGAHVPRYEQAERTDVTTLPPSRFELYDMSKYFSASIQVSRGCPFRCEFCDIIVTFGRVPRVKTPEQVIAELEALRARRVFDVYLADDNFIGNKKAVRPILEAIVEWQRRHGYPMILSTEASINLAEEDELLDLMGQANIATVFVGVESPSEESLKETQKVQNLKGRTGAGGLSVTDDIIRRLGVIRAKGIEVNMGMIVGFDSDRPDIFDRQREFVSRTGIPTVLVSMLAAIPTTPLHKRLTGEGRLDDGDPPPYGTNVVPLGMSQQQLRDGYVRLMTDLYAPEAFFGRLDASLASLSARWRRVVRTEAKSPRERLQLTLRAAVGSLLLYRSIMRHEPDQALRRTWRRRILGVVARPTRRLPLRDLPAYLMQVACHLHYQQFVRSMAADGRVRNTF
ncbi:Radical SAM superfamily enzyme YgiQ, UPF0313 family [Tistlia consotensis]|uniref:Radical SAM superfamily enzyme YgiQ, UPF0313 family n=1 Tax=Tistlia consotensis USBA 355 TaxID=560819 RepID=A0A1Y6BAI6_9PROT|nr:radical SAM protein [Tistlia consotensis]SME93267.1 Radical SAM superfamily enzyme YgiQ, UPF0313 family [Tistlia consotensis USBA 355]SNR28541.1 Radical SAM superfamily enzyme YgiQ, UPF0313 family [Tistlia consotensis]